MDHSSNFNVKQDISMSLLFILAQMPVRATNIIDFCADLEFEICMGTSRLQSPSQANTLIPTSAGRVRAILRPPRNTTPSNIPSLFWRLTERPFPTVSASQLAPIFLEPRVYIQLMWVSYTSFIFILLSLLIHGICLYWTVCISL